MPKALAIASVMSAEPRGIAVSPTQHAAHVDRDVGHLRAELDQRDAEIALLGGQAGVAGGERRGDHRLDFEVRVLHRLGQVAHRRAVGEHDVDVDPEPLGMEAPADWRRLRAPSRK